MWDYRSVSKVYDEWFVDEEKVRKIVGLLERFVVMFFNVREVCNRYGIIFCKFKKKIC